MNDVRERARGMGHGLALGEAREDSVPARFGRNWPLLALVATIPLQNVYIGKMPPLGPGLNYLNVMFVLAFLGWRYGRNLSQPTRSRIGPPLAFFMGTYVFSLLLGIVMLGYVGENHVRALKDIFVGFLFYYLVLGSVRDRPGVIRMLAATLLPLPLMFYSFRNQLHSVMRHLGVTSIGDMGHYNDTMRLVNGTFFELGSNELAAFYAGYTLMLIALAVFIRNLYVRAVLAALVLINLYGLLCSFSRGGWMSFLIGLAVLTLFVSRKALGMGVLVVLLSSGSIVALFPESVQERFQMIFVGEEERDMSAESRLIVWKIAMHEFAKSPILGIGFHVFHHRNTFEGKDTHNYFIKVLTEQGVIGFIVLLLVFYRIFWVSLRTYWLADDPLYKALGVGMVAVLAAFMVGNMFGDRLSHYPLGSYFWVYAALAQRALLLSQEGPERAEGP